MYPTFVCAVLAWHVYRVICFHDAFRDDIVIWARKKTGTPVTRISSEEEAEKFLRKYQMFLLGQFDKFEVSEIMI